MFTNVRRPILDIAAFEWVIRQKSTFKMVSVSSPLIRVRVETEYLAMVPDLITCAQWKDRQPRRICVGRVAAEKES